MNNPTTAKIETDGTIIQFLMGTHSFNGIWYGQKVSGPSFWWRAELRKYLEETPSIPSQPVSEEDELWEEVMDYINHGPDHPSKYYSVTRKKSPISNE